MRQNLYLAAALIFLLACFPAFYYGIVFALHVSPYIPDAYIFAVAFAPTLCFVSLSCFTAHRAESA